MGLIYALMKVYDPQSRVTQGDLANAANAGSVPDNILNLYNRIVKDGKGLQPAQRADYVETMKKVAQSQYQKFIDQADQSAKLAKKYGIDPADVVDPKYMNWTPDVATQPSGPQKVGRYIIQEGP